MSFQGIDSIYSAGHLGPITTRTRKSQVPQKSATTWGWPLFMAFVRLPLILVGYGIIGLALRTAGYPVEFEILSVFGTLCVVFTNLVCLGLLLWRARVEGFQLCEMTGFRRSRILHDLAQGAMWWIVLGALLFGGLFATWFAIRTIPNVSFEFGKAEFPLDALPHWMTVVYALIAGMVFPILNPPVEELQYRGYAQPRLISATGRVWLGIGLPAIGFGLQHMAFAFTASLTPVFAAGFLLWGVGAGVIAYRQKRLAPLIIAHFMSNLPFGMIPIFFVLQGAG